MRNKASLLQPAAEAWRMFTEHAATIEGEPRVHDTVLAQLMRCNPRIIRRHSRHHRFDRGGYARC